MSADTLVQIDQAQTGDLTNQHAAILIGLWHLVYGLGFGPGWILGLQLLAFAAGCYLVLRATFGRLAAAAITGMLQLAPLVFGMLGYVSRDVWFTALSLLVFGLAVRSAQDHRRRTMWTLAAFVVAFFAVVSRQNAASVVFLPLAFLVWQSLAPRWPGVGVLRSRLTTRTRRVVAAGAAGVAVTVGMVGVQQAIYAVLQVEDVAPQQQLYIYDLLAMSQHDDTNLLPPEVLPERGNEVIDRYWNVDSIVPILFSPDRAIVVPLPEELETAVSDAWRDAVFGDPLGYLRARAELFFRQLTFTRDANFIYHPQIDANRFGFAIRNAEANAQAKDYVQGFADDSLDGGVLYKLWVYQLAAIVAGILLLRRASEAQVVVGLLALSTLPLQAGLFFGAMGTQYRFEWPLVVFGVLGVIVAVGARRARPQHHPAAAQLDAA